MQTDSVASDVTSDGGLTVLAVDTSTDMLACAVARIAARADGAHGVDVLASGDHLCRRHANEQLVNTALDCLSQAGLAMGDVDAVLVGRGPGSFTGVRIGIATAKGLACGLGSALFGASTLDAVAWGAWAAGERGLLAVVDDAMRGEVYPGVYLLDDAGAHRTFDAERVVAADDAVAELAARADAAELSLAGDGLKKYRDVKLTYRGQVVDESLIDSDTLPDYAPDELHDLETLLPKPQDWSLDVEDYLGVGGYGSYGGGFGMGGGTSLPPEVANLYLFDDLGISQRWANKFSEAGIETVSDLVGQTQEDLSRIEGIGSKAIEELREGLERHDLLHILDNESQGNDSEVSQLLEMVFSPDDSSLLLESDLIQTYSADPDDMIGSSVPPISQIRDSAELDELFKEVGLTEYTLGEDDMGGLDDLLDDEE